MNSADLVARLRDLDDRTGSPVAHEAADRIAALEAWKAEAMEVLRFYADPFWYVTRHNIDEETPDFYDELDTGWRARRLVEKEDGL